MHLTNRRSEPNLRNNIIRHEHRPRRKIELLTSRITFALETFTHHIKPMAHSRIHQGLHLLDVGKRIWSGCYLSVVSVHMMLLHVEQRLGLAKRSGHIVLAFVGVAGVDLGQLSCVGDEKHCWCYS